MTATTRSNFTLTAVAALAVVTLVVAAVALTRGQTPAAAQAPPTGLLPADTVLVDGLGEAEAPPDTAVISMGVEILRPTAAEALEAVDTKSQAVLDAAEAAGVSAEDLQTTGLMLNPDYIYHENDAPTLRGYIATNDLRIEIDDIDTAGAVIGAVTEAAGDDGRLHGISFELDDDAATIAAARDRAFATAMAKARQYAELSGRELGAVRNVAESTHASPPPPIYASGGAMYGEEAATRDFASVAIGQSNISVTVTLTVELR